MRNDLRGALDEGYPEAIQASTPAAAAGQQSTLSRRVYEGCSSRPTPGTKLRYCGRCEVTVYCSEQCAKAHWADHELICETFRRAHEEVVAAHESRGGLKQEYNQMNRDLSNWFYKSPGLRNEIQLLAWTHRSKAPFIKATASQSDVDGSGVRVEMIPFRV